jgi:hypothetical protein
MPELQVLSGSLRWKTIPVKGERFLIGRKDSCHLAIKDGWASREHTLIIEPKTGEFRVQDLDSENGTYLNGERIRDAVLKHGDVLRVGRTELRFVQHSSSTPAFPFPSADGEAGVAPGEELGAADEAQGEDSPQTLKVDAESRTSTDEGRRTKSPRIDLKERVRRLEERLLEGEQANAALAAENAVLKRALARLGVLDRKTGAIDDRKLLSSSARAPTPPPIPGMITNPLARIAFPGLGVAGARPGASGGTSNPGLFDLGVLGIDALGIRFAERLSQLGYRRAAAVTAERDAMRGGVVEPAWRVYVDLPRAGVAGAGRGPDPALAAAMPRLEEVAAQAFGGTDRVLLCFGASSPLAADALSPLAEVVARSGGQPGLVVFLDPRDDLVDSRERSVRALAAARVLAESGRCAPFVVIDVDRAARLAEAAGGRDPALGALDTVAGALDALNRLPVVASSDAGGDPAAHAARILARGWATLGLWATRDPGAKALEEALGRAVSDGLLAGAMPPSRARSVVAWTIAGAERRAELDAERRGQALSRLLPQAQRIEGACQDAGDSVRVVVWVGGLPYPEAFLKDRES